VLSEIPEGWREAVDLWAAINEPRRHHGMLDRNTEYLLYQTLVGAWPISEERAVAYMEKAVREAKVHTSWIAPEPVYESAVRDFVSESLTDPEFLAALREFLPPVVAAGRVNSLAMKLLCLTAAGVADVYQGSELWDLSLVDPDNRRPVDFSLRCQLLNELDWADEQAAEVAWSRRDEGLPKLLVVNRTLRLRAEQPELFVRGSYDPLPVAGARAAHALAFSRGGGAVVVVPRLVVGMGGDWADTRVELPPGDWTDRFTGRRHPGGEVQLARLLHGFPVALLAPTGV